MIDLKPHKGWKKHSDVFCWVTAPPFFLNPRGILVHRVRHVETFQRDGKESHHAVTYLCGNCCGFELGSEDVRLLEVPPTDRLLCAFCEAKAIRDGQPRADKIAGRHVHVGVLRAHRICCGGEK